MLTTAAIEICSNAACLHALSHPAVCECPCAGLGHGRAWLSNPNPIRRTDMVGGFTGAMMSAMDEEAW